MAVCPFCGGRLIRFEDPASGWYSPRCGAYFCAHELIGTGTPATSRPVGSDPSSVELAISCPGGGEHRIGVIHARLLVYEGSEPFIEFACPGCQSSVECSLEPWLALRLAAVGLPIASPGSSKGRPMTTRGGSHDLRFVPDRLNLRGRDPARPA